MTINCDVILQWSATPEQLKALGVGLWRWCNRAAGDTGIYQYLDNQALADLIAGQLPAASRTPRPTERRAVHFQFRDRVSRDRPTAIANLRRAIPTAGIEDVLVNDKSWNLID